MLLSFSSDVSMFWVVTVLEDRQNQVGRKSAEASSQLVEVDDGGVESVQFAGDTLPVLACQQRWVRLIGPVSPSTFRGLLQHRRMSGLVVRWISYLFRTGPY